MPLAFAVMSRRKTRDYEAVFQDLKNVLPGDQPNMIVADFECAAWKAARGVLEGVELAECNFHWRQAIWKKVIVSQRCA